MSIPPPHPVTMAKQDHMIKLINQHKSQYIDFSGRVTKVDSKQNGIFAITNPTNNEQMRIQCQYFCPIRVNDLFYGVGQKKMDPLQGQLLVLTRPPLVTLPHDQTSVVSCFVQALRGTRFGTIKGNQLYDLLITLAEGSAKVTPYLDQLAFGYSKTYDKAFGYPLYEKLDEKQSIKLLTWWHKNRNLRRLYLFGLTNKEIDNSHRDLNDLYECCTTDPYKIMSIPLDKAKQIYDRINKEPTPEAEYRGKIIRKIYDNTIGRAWMGTPSRFVESTFPDIEKHVDFLYEHHPITGDDRIVYLSKYYHQEVYCAQYVHYLTAKSKQPFETPNRQIKFLKTTLNLEQKSAVAMSLNENLSIITGGAGTGKTTIIGEIIYNLEKEHIPYMIVSFTGKAVARIKEVIHRNTPSTMHRMIGRGDPLVIEKFEYLVIDEASMVTAELFQNFVSKFSLGMGFDYKIILIGDNNQLEPIGAGALFSQLILSGIVPTTTLVQNHRCDALGDNGILRNANAIVNYFASPEVEDEDYDEYDRLYEEEDPFTLTDADNFRMMNGDENSVIALVEILYQSGATCNDITVVCPYNDHVKSLNKKCQAIFDKGEKHFVDTKGNKWRIGDRLMNLKNNYDIDKMNGEECILIDILPPGTPIEVPDESPYYVRKRAEKDSLFSQLVVQFSDGVTYKYIGRYPDRDDSVGNEDKVVNTLDCLCHAYAITVHKSQGSEWQYIIAYIPPGHQDSTFLNYKLIYTMITRARKLLFAVGDIECLITSAIRKTPYRCDNLARRIKKLVASTIQTNE